jgi:hypothetical protein
MAAKRGAHNHAASVASTAAATAAPAAAAEAATVAPEAATAALTATAGTAATKRPARACTSPAKMAKIADVHGEVETTAGTTEESAEAPLAKGTPATSYNMRKRLPRAECSSSQNDEDELDDDDELDKDDELEKDDEAADVHTPSKGLPVKANLKRGRGWPPKPSSPQGTSNPYP